MQNNIKYILYSLLLAAALPTQAAITMTGTTYSQNFDSLAGTTPSILFSPPTLGTNVQVSFGGSTGFEGAKIGGNGTTALEFLDNAGSDGTGRLYSFGAAGSGDRALGTVGATAYVGAFGLKITNGSGQTFNDLSFSFFQENWRSGNVNNTITFGYSTGASDGTFLSSAGFTALSSLNLTTTGDGAGGFVTDGNLTANRILRTGTITGLNLLDGQSIYIRWQDANDTGNDAGVAIDDFNVTATVSGVPEPSRMLLLGLGFSGLLLRRRRTA